MNFVGNYYKAGFNSKGNLAFAESTPTAKAYFKDNCMNGEYPNDPWSLVTFSKLSGEDIKAYKQSGPILVPSIETDDAISAYRRVLSSAGATGPRRDAVDIRVVNEVINRTGKIINDEIEVGGWPELKSTEPPADTDWDGMPDDWERRHGLDIDDPADKNGDADRDGYTNLEEYLNALI
jgi:hypothetical protein